MGPIGEEMSPAPSTEKKMSEDNMSTEEIEPSPFIPGSADTQSTRRLI